MYTSQPLPHTHTYTHTPPPNTHRAMASPEYTTMIECTVELTEDFGNNLQEIASLLHSKHLISPSVKEQALHSNHELPTMRANKLVSVLTSRVQIQPEAFEQIVELMDPRYFSLSLAALKRQYKQNSKYYLSVIKFIIIHNLLL